MGICADKSVNYLQQYGFNIVREPSSGIAPLQLIGEYRGAIGVIGTLDQLVDSPTRALPAVSPDTPAANISGQKTSKLPLDLGVTILAGVIKALGGDVGVTANFQNARSLQFGFEKVQQNSAQIVAIGDYLGSGAVRWNQIILKKYLFGPGNLYVITDTLKANKFTVTATGSNQAGVALNLPAIQQVLSGKVSASYEGNQQNVISFEGTAGTPPLVFGFKAIEFSASENKQTGELSLTFQPVGDGNLQLGIEETTPTAFRAAGALESLQSVSPEDLGN